jgi:hypothetical protein
MNKPKIIYRSKESIHGKHFQSKEWIQYSLDIIVKDAGKNPVSIEMTFVPPHPFVMDMPLHHSIKSESLSQAFIKIARFFYSYGFDLRN